MCTGALGVSTEFITQYRMKNAAMCDHKEARSLVGTRKYRYRTCVMRLRSALPRKLASPPCPHQARTELVCGHGMLHVVPAGWALPAACCFHGNSPVEYVPIHSQGHPTLCMPKRSCACLAAAHRAAWLRYTSPHAIHPTSPWDETAPSPYHSYLHVHEFVGSPSSLGQHTTKSPMPIHAPCTAKRRDKCEHRLQPQ